MIVHPRHGVAEVRGIKTREVGESRTSFLELALVSPSLQILVPMDSVEEVGIRQLPTKQEVEAILALLSEPSEVSAVWSERSAETVARMKSTELAQASMVIRDLTRHERRSGKPLSASESGSLQSCLRSVASEIALVLGIGEDEARALLLERASTEDERSSASA